MLSAPGSWRPMSKDSGRPRDPQVDARILDAARSLLQEGGLAQLSIASVAARAGVGRPTVYRRFETREDIALQVLYDDLEALVIVAAASHDRGAPVLDQLLDIARPFLTYYAKDRSLSAALLQLGIFHGGEWQQRYANQAMTWLAGLAEGLQAATTDGRLHADVDTLLLMQAFFGFYLSIAIGGANGVLGGVDDQLALLRKTLEQHLRGLVPSA